MKSLSEEARNITVPTRSSELAPVGNIFGRPFPKPLHPLFIDRLVIWIIGDCGAWGNAVDVDFELSNFPRIDRVNPMTADLLAT